MQRQKPLGDGGHQLRVGAPELTAESGVVVFSAAGKNQLSRESPQWQHGAFTAAAVLEAAAAVADLDGDGLISLTGLEHYVSKR